MNSIKKKLIKLINSKEEGIALDHFINICLYKKDGYYVNLEGRIQKAFKASYPPGESKEDWEIINNISQFLNKRLDITNKFDLETKLIKSNNLYSKESYITKEKNSS